MIKISIPALGIIATIGMPFGIVHSVNAMVGPNKKTDTGVVRSQQRIVQSWTGEELIGRILEGKLNLLTLKVQDFMKVIGVLKSDQPNQLKTCLEHLAPNVLKKIRAIDTTSFYLVLDIIFNRGLLNLSQADILEMTRVIKLVVKKQAAPWWAELIRRMVVILHGGLNTWGRDHNNEILHKVVVHVVGKMVQRIIVKPPWAMTAKQQVKKATVVALK